MAEYKLAVSERDLARLPPDEQREVMEDWFRERYEDPDNRTPYDSEDGDYVWIWGGPFDAREVLSEEFENVVPESFIDGLASDLDAECPEWAPIESDNDYDHDLLEVVTTNVSSISTLRESLNVVGGLCKVETDLKGALHRLLYANVISALETYLSDTFVNAVLADDSALRRFIETTPEFKKTSIAYSEIFSAVDGARERAKHHLLSLVWHNIAKVQPMYRESLRVDMGDGLAEVAKAIVKRHDIVHRSGRDREGNPVLVSANEVLGLIQAVENLAAKIEEQLVPPEPEF